MDEPIWLTRTMIGAVHADQIVEHGGGGGIREEGLLESALARPRDRWGYDPDTDLAALAAAYGFGIARNHPFVDGNKRTSLMAIYTFLAVNDLELEASEPEAVDMTVGLADGSVSGDDLAAWIRAHLVPWVD
jgi:death-on-curing protein